jgi:hypothetical protein
MTAIAYRAGVMCADSATFADSTFVGTVEKIARAPDGSIGAATGPTSACAKFRRWIEGGMMAPFTTGAAERDFLGMLVKPDGTVLYIEDDGVPYEVKAPFHTLGCAAIGMNYAMAAGASAHQAVAIASNYSDGVWGKIQTVYLDPGEWRLPLTFDQICDAFAAGFHHAKSGAVSLVGGYDAEPSDSHPVCGNTIDLGPHISPDDLIKLAVRFGTEALVLLTEWRKQHPSGVYYHPACLGDPGTRCGLITNPGDFQRDVGGVRLTALVPPPADATEGAVASLSWCLGLLPVSAKH